MKQKKRKKALSLVLCLALVLGLAPGMSIAAYADTSSGIGNYILFADGSSRLQKTWLDNDGTILAIGDTAPVKNADSAEIAGWMPLVYQERTKGEDSGASAAKEGEGFIANGEQLIYIYNTDSASNGMVVVPDGGSASLAADMSSITLAQGKDVMFVKGNGFGREEVTKDNVTFVTGEASIDNFGTVTMGTTGKTEQLGAKLSADSTKIEKYGTSTTVYVVATPTIAGKYKAYINEKHCEKISVKEWSSADARYITITPNPDDSSKATAKNVQYDTDNNKRNIQISAETEVYGTLSLQITSCLASGTLVTMADGTKKPIEDVAPGDLVMTWSFWEGCYEAQPVTIKWDHGIDEYTILTLHFSDGTSVDTINGHGFFDATKNGWAFIEPDNAQDYIGDSFVKQNKEGSNEEVVLVDAVKSIVNTGCYSLQTAYNDNFMAEDMLSITMEDVPGRFEYFELGEDMKYDADSMARDIKNYGLYTAEDFAEYLTAEQFEMFSGPYFKVLVGRGVLTYDYILNMIQRDVPKAKAPAATLMSIEPKPMEAGGRTVMFVNSEGEYLESVSGVIYGDTPAPTNATLASGKVWEPVVFEAVYYSALTDETPLSIKNNGEVLSGAPVPGDILSVECGATHLMYQWKADGEDVSGATEAEYTVRDEDGGKELTVTVYQSKKIDGTEYAISERPSKTSYGVHIHAHSLSYTLSEDGSVLTATCANEDGGCLLPEVEGRNIASLIVVAPESIGGEASVTAEPAGFFKSLSELGYQTRQEDGSWKDVSSAPSSAGLHRAYISANDQTVYALYGIYTVAYSADNGSVSGLEIAMAGSQIEPIVTPNEGYELDELVVTQGTDTVALDDNNSFIMPEADVNVRASFKKKDYAITITSSENGKVTADTTAQMGDTVTLNVVPNSGYILDSLKYNDGQDHTIVMDNGSYSFTMPASSVTVSGTFDKLETYTIFYRASSASASVKFRMTENGEGSGMTNSARLGDVDCWAVQFSAAKNRTSFPVAFQEDGGTWGDLATLNVVNDIPNDLDAGSAVIVEGEAKAFIISFLWGDIEEDDSGSYQAEEGKSKNFLVTNNTESVAIEAPQKNGYTFLGWDDGESESLRQASGGSLDISEISETSIFAARYEQINCTVSYDLNGGSGNAPDATVPYEGTVTSPVSPTKAGYSFARWVVAESTAEKVEGTEKRLAAGSAFDFANTQIINDLKLKAEWKHVHSYVRLQLNDSTFNGAFNDISEYAPYVHVRICTSMDDYCAEAHSYNALGVCACGAIKPGSRFKLEKSIDQVLESTTQVIANSVVSVSAPATKNGNQFSKWQYHDGATWRTLSTSPYTAFVIPADLKVNAVYEASKAELAVESFMYKGYLAFQFNYSVPKGMTVVDAGLLTGNNSHIRYMDAKQLQGASGLADVMLPFIPTTEMPVHYDPSKGNALEKFGAAKVAKKMFMEEAINVPGKSNPIFKRCAVLGRTGSAALAINTSAGNIYYYGTGYVICRDSAGRYVAFMTDAIGATKNDPNKSATSSNPVQ